MNTHIRRLILCTLCLLLTVGMFSGCISGSAEDFLADGQNVSDKGTPPTGESAEKSAEKSAEETTENTSDRLTLDRSKIIISVWDYGQKVAQTEEGAASLKEFGADLVVHPSTAAAFDMLTKYGIPSFGVKVNVPYSTLSKQLLEILGHIRLGAYDNIADGYSGEPSIIGDYVYDEVPPLKDVFLTFRRLVQLYQEQMPEQLCYLIINPAYPTGTMGDFSSYQEYVETFCRMVPVDYISFDVYPFYRQEGNAPYVTKFLGEYLLTNDVNAEAARKYDRDMWVIFQAGSDIAADEEYALVTNEQLRYQMFTSLAYGATNLCYANYTRSWWKANTSLWHSSSNKVGNKTYLWDIAKPINDEIHALSDTFMRYESMGVYTFGNSVDPSLDLQLKQQNERSTERGYTAESIDGFADITTNGGLLCGGFLEKEGDGCAAMFVNQLDPFTADAAVTFTFRVTETDAAVVTAHHHGISEELTAKDGVYSFTLGSGEGVFITVE